MNKIRLKMFDSSFTRHLVDSLANLGVSNVGEAANDNNHGAPSRREIERDIEKAEKALRKLSNTELHDLGISRGEIAYVVRHGRPGIDPDPDPAGMQAA